MWSASSRTISPPIRAKNSAFETTLGPVGLALVVVEEDQVDVGAVVELLRRRACPGPGRRTARARRRRRAGRRTAPRRAPGPAGTAAFDAGVGQVREVLRDHFQRKAADDVVVADPQALALAEPPQRQRSARSRRRAPASVVPEVVDQASLGRGARARARSQSSSVGIADQHLAEVLAGAEDLEQDLGRPARRRPARGASRRARAPRPGTARGSPAPCPGRGSAAGRRRAGRRAGRRQPGTPAPARRVRSREVAAPALGIANAQPGQPALRPARGSRDRSGTSRRSSARSRSCREPWHGSIAMRRSIAHELSNGSAHEPAKSGADVLEVAEDRLDVAAG